MVLLFVLLASCKVYRYEGKEIESLEYVTIDYFGGYRDETIVDLIKGEVLKRSYFPTDEQIPEYSVIYTFETSDIDNFLDEFGASDIFNLKLKYETSDVIMDGAGWIFIINYADGTNKTSTGDNAWPNIIFEKADAATINLYGDALFKTS